MQFRLREVRDRNARQYNKNVMIYPKVSDVRNMVHKKSIELMFI